MRLKSLVHTPKASGHLLKKVIEKDIGYVVLETQNLWAKFCSILPFVLLLVSEPTGEGKSKNRKRINKGARVI